MHCSFIIKEYSETWFHYDTETCGLKVEEVWDYDYEYDDSDWNLVETDRQKDIAIAYGRAMD